MGRKAILDQDGVTRVCVRATDGVPGYSHTRCSGCACGCHDGLRGDASPFDDARVVMGDRGVWGRYAYAFDARGCGAYHVARTSATTRIPTLGRVALRYRARHLAPGALRVGAGIGNRRALDDAVWRDTHAPMQSRCRG